MGGFKSNLKDLDRLQFLRFLFDAPLNILYS